MRTRDSAILVSVLPRGEPFGSSALLSLDPETLQILSIREFPSGEYLVDPDGNGSGPIQHCRGLACSGPRLFAALFNGVREYEIEDARNLRLRPGRLLTHPRGSDLHGLDVSGTTLAAASTGTDSVVFWDLRSGEANVIPLGETGVADLRFPAKLALESGESDWRRVLEAQLHANGVALRPDGSVVICTLTGVAELTRSGPRPIYEDDEAKLHDCCAENGDELLLTDAARGLLISLDVSSGQRRCCEIVTDPREWFVRGVGVLDDRIYVLSSEVMSSRQRSPLAATSCEASARGSSFLISIVDPDLGPVKEETVRMPQMARGTVAYSLVGYKSEA